MQPEENTDELYAVVGNVTTHLSILGVDKNPLLGCARALKAQISKISKNPSPKAGTRYLHFPIF